MHLEYSKYMDQMTEKARACVWLCPDYQTALTPLCLTVVPPHQLQTWYT